MLSLFSVVTAERVRAQALLPTLEHVCDIAAADALPLAVLFDQSQHHSCARCPQSVPHCCMTLSSISAMMRFAQATTVAPAHLNVFGRLVRFCYAENRRMSAMG